MTTHLTNCWNNLVADENVVVIGGGPSGRDVVFAVSATAKNVYFSTHRNLPQNLFPANVTLKPDIKEFKENSVVFVDGSEANIDTTFYCTGKLATNCII